MSDIWSDLQFLLRQGHRSSLSAEEKLDLLAQMVANLIDEVEILKEYAWTQSGLSREEWLERYRKERLWLLFSGQGGMPPCIRKYLPYLKNRQETARELIPDPAEREAKIQGLANLS